MRSNPTYFGHGKADENDPSRKRSVHRNDPDNDGLQLVFCAPGQFPSLAGQEHGRTLPSPDVDRHEIGLTTILPHFNAQLIPT